jgi:hypothetical protein
MYGSARYAGSVTMVVMTEVGDGCLIPPLLAAAKNGRITPRHDEKTDASIQLENVPIWISFGPSSDASSISNAPDGRHLAQERTGVWKTCGATSLNVVAALGRVLLAPDTEYFVVNNPTLSPRFPWDCCERRAWHCEQVRLVDPSEFQKYDSIVTVRRDEEQCVRHEWHCGRACFSDISVLAANIDDVTTLQPSGLRQLPSRHQTASSGRHRC